MKTSQELLEDMLLTGAHINKFLFYERTGTICLAQRILDIKQTKGWFIRSKSVEGKGSLREYWLDKEEIARIKKAAVEQPSVSRETNAITIEPVRVRMETPEQCSLGLFGENKYNG